MLGRRAGGGAVWSLVLSASSPLFALTGLVGGSLAVRLPAWPLSGFIPALASASMAHIIYAPYVDFGLWSG